MDEKNNDRKFPPLYQTFSGMLNMAGQHNGQLSIIELRVPVETQMEYFHTSNKMRGKSDRPAINADDAPKLYDDSVSEETKKGIISNFALSHDVKLYRFLQEFHAAQAEGSHLRDWTSMALVEFRISIESELLDEKQVYISTGLGGRDYMLRYCVVMIAEDKKPFLPYQREMIEREIPFGLAAYGCEAERIVVHDLHVEMMMLAPLTGNIKTALANVVEECNSYGNFISPDVTVTNIREFTEEEIQCLIDKKGIPPAFNLHQLYDYAAADEEEDFDDYEDYDEEDDEDDEDDE